MPSPSVADFVCNGFAILDAAESIIYKFPEVPTKPACELVLNECMMPAQFTCDKHRAWGMKFAIKSIINIFNNNKQKVAADKVRKDVVVGMKKNKREQAISK